MIAPGGGGSPADNAPTIYNLSITCSVTPTTGDSVVAFDVNKTKAGVTCQVYIHVDGDPNNTPVWSGDQIPANQTTKRYTVSPGLANGDYVIVAYNDDAEAEAKFSVNCGPVSGGGGGGTSPLTLTATAQAETAAGRDGKITATPAGGNPPLTLLLVETGAQHAAVAGQADVFSGLSGGSYNVRVTDSSSPAVVASAAVTVVGYVPPATGGCTDPAATNYAAGATADDGSCAYSPPPALPGYFSVPLLQALRFVLRGDWTPAGPDGTLFCEQSRPGQQVRPLFYQPVAQDDVVRVQVLTSYTAVAATIYHHGGSQVGAAVPLAQALTLEGSAAPLAVVLSQNTATGTTRLAAKVGGALPPSLLAAARLALAGGAAGTYRVTQAVPGSVVNTDDYLVLNRPWVAPGAAAVTATWVLSGPGFNVWEAELPVAALAAGYYQVRLRATRAGLTDAVADSEPMHVRAAHPNTLAIDYCNADNCFGMVFSTGITPRLRVPGTFFRQKNGGSSSTYRDSAGALAVLSSTAQRQLSLETYALPAWLHEKLFLACRLDFLQVEGVRCQTDQSYEVSESRTYPLAGGRIALEQTPWLGAGNGDDFGMDENAPDNALQLRDGDYLLLRGK